MAKHPDGKFTRHFSHDETQQYKFVLAPSVRLSYCLPFGNHTAYSIHSVHSLNIHYVKSETNNVTSNCQTHLPLDSPRDELVRAGPFYDGSERLACDMSWSWNCV